MKKLLVFIFVSIFTVLAFLRVSYAQSPAVSGYQPGSFNGSFSNRPSGTIPNIPIEQIKTRILAALDKKIDALNKLPEKIDANTNLTDEQKAQLKAKVAEVTALLEELKSKIQAAQTQEELLNILKEFIQTRQGINSTQGNQLSSAQSMQNMVSNLQLRGADTASVQQTVTQLKTLLGQQQDSANQLGTNITNAASIGDIPNGLQQASAQGNDKTKQELIQLWQQLKQQLQQIKTQRPDLFPTRVPPNLPSRSVTRPINITCKPRPSCLEMGRCDIAEPVEGWCQPGTTVFPTRIPSPTRTVSVTRPVGVTCQPRPKCLDSYPYCMMPEPVEGWCTPKASPTGGGGGIACTADAKQCPDGKTWVGRIPPSCQFAPCPTGGVNQ